MYYMCMWKANTRLGLSDALQVSTSTQISLTFSEAVVVGSGEITLSSYTTAGTLQTQAIIDVASSQIAISGSQLVITPETALAHCVSVHVEVASTGLTDTSWSRLAFPGLQSSDFIFSTACPPTESPTSSPTSTPTIPCGCQADDESIFTLPFELGVRAKAVWVLLTLMVVYMVLVDYLHDRAEEAAKGDRCYSTFMGRVNAELMMFGVVAISLFVGQNFVAKMDHDTHLQVRAPRGTCGMQQVGTLPAQSLSLPYSTP